MTPLAAISQIHGTFRSVNTFRASPEIESEINNFLLTLEFKKEEISMLLKGFSEEEKKAISQALKTPEGKKALESQFLMIKNKIRQTETVKTQTQNSSTTKENFWTKVKTIFTSNVMGNILKVILAIGAILALVFGGKKALQSETAKNLKEKIDLKRQKEELPLLSIPEAKSSYKELEAKIESILNSNILNLSLGNMPNTLFDRAEEAREIMNNPSKESKIPIDKRKNLELYFQTLNEIGGQTLSYLRAYFTHQNPSTVDLDRLSKNTATLEMIENLDSPEGSLYVAIAVIQERHRNGKMPSPEAIINRLSIYGTGKALLTAKYPDSTEKISRTERATDTIKGWTRKLRRWASG